MSTKKQSSAELIEQIAAAQTAKTEAEAAFEADHSRASWARVRDARDEVERLEAMLQHAKKREADEAAERERQRLEAVAKEHAKLDKKIAADRENRRAAIIETHVSAIKSVIGLFASISAEDEATKAEDQALNNLRRDLSMFEVDSASFAHAVRRAVEAQVSLSGLGRRDQNGQWYPTHDYEFARTLREETLGALRRLS